MLDNTERTFACLDCYSYAHRDRQARWLHWVVQATAKYDNVHCTATAMCQNQQTKTAIHHKTPASKCTAEKKTRMKWKLRDNYSSSCTCRTSTDNNGFSGRIQLLTRLWLSGFHAVIECISLNCCGNQCSNYGGASEGLAPLVQALPQTSIIGLRSALAIRPPWKLSNNSTTGGNNNHHHTNYLQKPVATTSPLEMNYSWPI